MFAENQHHSNGHLAECSSHQGVSDEIFAENVIAILLNVHLSKVSQMISKIFTENGLTEPY